VWRTCLLRNMLRLGIPLRYVQWTSAWLTNRIARVQFNGAYGTARTFKEGLPQGSVLSLLLLVIYINDLLGGFDKNTLVSAYADDLAIACRGRNKTAAAAKFQDETNRVVQWPETSRLQLNSAKCETVIFTLDATEANWQPTISNEERLLNKNPTPTFLGVRFDRQLTFNAHVNATCQKATQRLNLLRTLGGSTWGWNKKTSVLCTSRHNGA